MMDIDTDGSTTYTGIVDTFTKVQINQVIDQSQIEATDPTNEIPASKISTGLVDNDEFNTLNNIDTTKTIETRIKVEDAEGKTNASEET